MRQIKIYGHATFRLENENIIHCKIKNQDVHNKLDYKTAQLFVDSIINLADNKSVSLLIDLTDVKGTYSTGAAQYISKCINEMSFITNEAFIINSLSMKLLVQAYKRIYRTKVPHGIFTSIKEAKDFCKEFKN